MHTLNESDPVIAQPVSPGEWLLHRWQQLARIPGGRWLFSRLLGRFVPYSGTIVPRVLALEPGHARLLVRDRARVRNHLNSIHAIALANLGELTSGLALLTALRPGTRGIVVQLTVEYFKKARGTLTAETRCNAPEVANDDVEHLVIADIRDGTDEIVARTTVRWRIGPV